MNKPIIKTYEKEQNMINAKITDIPVPVTRTEHFMYSAITGNESGLKADAQAEMYLDAIKNSDTSDLEGIEPRTVLDMYLEARQTGNLDDLPKPRTTSEMLLYQAITGEDLGAKPVSNMDKYLSLLEPNNYDARLEIESEESVIHLADSKNGRVEVKELEGNTMVNYVTDGIKELTLNNEINIEGTNVTLTDTVDNGKVDVGLEGNTIINCLATKIERNIKFVADGTAQSYYYRTIPKGNTVYTLVANVVKNTINSNFSLIGWNITHDNKQCKIPKGFVGAFKQTFTTKENIGSNWYMDFWKENTIGEIEFNNFMILEGDWTNKEVLPYFEGMKSVAECEDNKIEIVSQNKNLFDGKWLPVNIIVDTGEEQPSSGECFSDYINVSGLERVYGRVYNYNGNATYFKCRYYDANFKYLKGEAFYFNGNDNNYVTLDKNIHYIRISIYAEPINVANTTNVMISLNNPTGYVPCQSNKKQITLSEPLRALPNGVKDKIVKIGGKHYVERNCGNIKLDGSEGWTTSGANIPFGILQIPLKPNGNMSNALHGALCDRLIITNIVSNSMSDNNKGVYLVGSGTNSHIRIRITDEDTKDSIKQWLSQNPTTVVYQLETPIYEELPIDPTLNTYNDITHISNNSTIPCNMKIQNTGYNAIIKPSTQYTVAFDTDKAGEVGINLAGSKVTTNNNVATVTTPSTLVGDSLRLTGKGIKVSRVRLLEGDKINYIPGYFEGMKSSFEDKLQEDGTFKMEILSNNRSLIDWSIENLENHHASQYDFSIEDNAIKVRSNYSKAYGFKKGFYVQKGEKYTISVEGKRTSDSYSAMYLGGEDLAYPKRETYILVPADTNGNILNDSYGTKTVTMVANKSGYINRWIIHSSGKSNFYWIKNIFLEKGESVSCVPSICNKIQFSSIKPLRGLPNGVRDKIVVKNGKLMIERNIGNIRLDRNRLWNFGANTGLYGFNCEYLLVYLNDQECAKINMRVSSSAMNDIYSLSNNFITLSRNQGYNIKAQKEYMSFIALEETLIFIFAHSWSFR